MRMLTWLTDAALAESIAGDLAEERRRRGARSGVAAAHVVLAGIVERGALRAAPARARIDGV